MGDPKHPVPGDLHIDASDIVPVDNPKGSAKKLRKLRDGYKDAVTTLLNLSPAMLARAGIDPAQIALLKTSDTEMEAALAFVPPSKKLVELMLETGQTKADVVAGIIEESAANTRRRLKRDTKPDELKAALEVVLMYQSAVAEKGVKTKIKTGKLKPKTAKTAKTKAAAAPAATAATTKA